MSSRLFQILCDLVSGAQAAPKCPQYTRLQRGLHVEVMFDGEVYRLRLWRDSGRWWSAAVAGTKRSCLGR